MSKNRASVDGALLQAFGVESRNRRRSRRKREAVAFVRRSLGDGFDRDIELLARPSHVRLKEATFLLR